MIKVQDSLEFMKEQEDFSADIIYSDPPYNLGSEIIVREDGKMDYKTKGDFMNKWEAMSGEWWNEWFKQAYRTLKYGGYLIMFNIDRQCALFEYYAHLAKFKQRQSLYWYFISSFPKSTDLSKMIDKNAGAEREVVDKNKSKGIRSGAGNAVGDNYECEGYDITAPSTDLAKKYNGYKYSIAPLKQTCEVILVFQKRYKTKSCLHDTLALENGDTECACGALAIDNSRVPTSEEITNHSRSAESAISKGKYGDSKEQKTHQTTGQEQGRYPSQTFCDSKAAARLDSQSGISKSTQAERGVMRNGYTAGCEYEKAGQETNTVRGHNDTGGCSKILHTCDYSKGEHDLLMYCPKVSGRERNGGLEGFEDSVGGNHNDSGRSYKTKCRKCEKEIRKDSRENRCMCEQPEEYYPEIKMKNHHPTTKPIQLNERILTLFKTPNEQKILYPFAGVFSEAIGGYKAGFKNFAGCEINSEYVEIGKARFEYWKDRPLDVIEKEVIISEEQQALF